MVSRLEQLRRAIERQSSYRFYSCSLLVVYEGYQKDFSGFGHSSSALQMNEESISSTFVNDGPHTSDGCYDGDINNSSPDSNVTMEKEISQTSTLRRGFAEATVKETKRIASFTLQENCSLLRPNYNKARQYQFLIEPDQFLTREDQS